MSTRSASTRSRRSPRPTLEAASTRTCCASSKASPAASTADTPRRHGLHLPGREPRGNPRTCRGRRPSGRRDHRGRGHGGRAPRSGAGQGLTRNEPAVAATAEHAQAAPRNRSGRRRAARARSNGHAARVRSADADGQVLALRPRALRQSRLRALRVHA